MQHRKNKLGRATLGFALALGAFGALRAPSARALGFSDSASQPAPEIQGGTQDDLLKLVKFDQKLDSQVPLDATFRDENGKSVKLSDYFNGKPVVLVGVYYHCTMLCSEVLKSAIEATKGVSFTAGHEYNVVAISIDPRETPKIASDEKAEQTAGLNKTVAANGFHFLTGDAAQIHRVTDAIGFHYVYDPKTDEYAHPNGLVILTPHGKVTRYLYGIDFKSRDMKFGLMEAAEERIGSPVDQLVLCCFHFDPKTGTYDLVITKVLSVLAALTMLLLGGGVGLTLRREKKNRSRTDNFLDDDV